MEERVLITGSSRGLGKELAKIYAKNGHGVIIHGRNPERLVEAREKMGVEGLGEKCLFYQGDLNDSAAVEGLAQMAINEGVSTLVNNAARSFSGDLSKEPTEEILQTNLLAPIALTQRIFPYLVSNGRGKIINILSIDALNAKGRRAGYSASKFGLRGFTDSLRFEAKDHNIRVVSVFLGGMNTDMYRETGEDATLCMDPSEVAEIIFNATKTYNLTGVDSITINRQKY